MKNFAVVERERVIQDGDSRGCVATEVQNLNFKKYKNKKSGSTEGETVEVQRLNGNYNNNSYTEKKYINLTTDIDSKLVLHTDVDGVDDGMNAVLDYVTVVKENIEYDCFMQDKKWKDRDLYDELFQLICDVS